MKSTFLSFSRLPILYHRRREFDGWKQSNATHRGCTMFSSFAKENHCAIEKSAKNGSPVLTSQPTIPRLPPCAVLYRTGSEISRICWLQKRGRKIDRELIFSIFIREQHEDSIKQIKKNLSYTRIIKVHSICLISTKVIGILYCVEFREWIIENYNSDMKLCCTM